MAETPSPPATQNGRSSRVFSESDEAELLSSLLKANQASPSPRPTVDAETLDRVAKNLGSKFTPSQISDKLRRLRTKYRKKSRSRSRFKTPHEERLFAIAAEIWGKKKTLEINGDENGEIGGDGEELRNNEATTVSADEQLRNHGASRGAGEEQLRNNGAIRGAGEEQLRNNGASRGGAINLDGFPYLVAEFSRILPENEAWKEGLRRLGEGKLKEMNDKWKLFKIEEAALVAMKAEMVQEHVKVVMDAAIH